MARDHARIRISIAEDTDVEDLSVDAQLLYFRILLPDPKLSYAGVTDWRPKRLTRKARDLTLPRVLAAAAELEEARYALFDVDTEEVLVRSYIRRDELLKNPKMAACVTKDYQTAASKTLRAAIVSEVQRVQGEHPEYSSWKHKDSAERLARLVTQPNLETVGYTNQIHHPEPVENTNPNPVQNTNPEPVEIPNQNTNPDPGPEHQSRTVQNTNPIRSGFPDTNTPHPSPHTLGGYVSPEGHQRDTTVPPPSKCPRHENTIGPIPSCRDCADARRRRETWDTHRVHAMRTDAAERRDAIRECAHCDEGGWRIPPAELRDADLPVIRCDHTPMDDDGWLGLLPDEETDDA